MMARLVALMDSIRPTVRRGDVTGRRDRKNEDQHQHRAPRRGRSSRANWARSRYSSPTSRCEPSGSVSKAARMQSVIRAAAVDSAGSEIGAAGLAGKRLPASFAVAGKRAERRVGQQIDPSVRALAGAVC